MVAFVAMAFSLRVVPTLRGLVPDGEHFLSQNGSLAFAKAELDPEFVAAEEARVTRGFQRLREVLALGLPIVEYPLPEVRDRWR